MASYGVLMYENSTHDSLCCYTPPIIPILLPFMKTHKTTVQNKYKKIANFILKKVNYA